MAEILDGHRAFLEQRESGLRLAARGDDAFPDRALFPAHPGAQQEVAGGSAALEHLAVLHVQRAGDELRGLGEHMVQSPAAEGALT